MKIEPGATIGIIGGGQLGKMMAIVAKYYGYKIAVLDPTPDSPTEGVADISLIAAYDDMDAFKKLGEISDVVTYEFENIPFASVKEAIKKTLFHLPQGHRPLEVCQNRISEKQAIEQAGAKVSPYAHVKNETDLQQFGEKHGFKFIIKTTEMGYDGKGQMKMLTKEAIHNEEVVKLITQQECVVEKLVPFDKELSVIVFRDLDGNMETLSTCENIHYQGILQQTLSPAMVDSATSQKAQDLAKQIMTNLDFIGTLAVEMFLVGDDILINEMAPRPHNSGHFSIEGSSFSQFEQHIRSICKLPLGKNRNYGYSTMINILGEHYDKSISFFTNNKDLQNTYFHFYGKKGAKKGRKMGHVTFVADSYELLRKRADVFLDEVIRL